MKNVLVDYLRLLGVRHTADYASWLYREHPYRDSLFGLSQMLSDYHVQTLALRLEKKVSELLELDAPFIAFANNEFVLVHRLSPDQISYYWRDGKSITLDVNTFLGTWSGVVLLAEKTEQSGEPDYEKHRKAEWVNRGEKMLLGGICLILLCLLLRQQTQLPTLYLLLSTLFNLAGLYVSWLLLLKQIGIQNKVGDKVCSLFNKKSSCNDVLQSPGAKFLGIIGLSEIGVSYFLSSLLLLLTCPECARYYALTSLLALPFTLWSVYYQWLKVHIWCPLCLIVQGILWINALINCCNGIFPEAVEWNVAVFVGCIYLLPLLIVNLFIRKYGQQTDGEEIRYQLNRLKANKEVFNALLQKENAYYPTVRAVSSICWGNVKAKHVITVVTNPHCDPCAALHQKLVQFLEKGKDKFCIQYIFTSFSKELSISAKFLISVYRKNDEATFLSILDAWYKTGKYHKETFFKQYDFEPTLQDEEEYARHTKFVMEHQIRSTPTVLFNGYKKPEMYTLEDLLYIV